jgi:nucleotide-binding universal stress UspA family protein
MYQRILVPFDGSPTSTQGLDEAIKLARLTGASLRLLHVINELAHVTGFESYSAYAGDVLPLLKADGEQILEQGRSRAAAAGVPVETQLIENFAARLSDLVIEQVESWKADLIVLGTHGRRGVQRLMLGSDAELIVRAAPVPVLLVRAPDAPTKASGA